MESRGVRPDYPSDSSDNIENGSDYNSENINSDTSNYETYEDSIHLRIVSGVAVARGNVPWQVNIGIRGVPKLSCGGTIVAMDVSWLKF